MRHFRKALLLAGLFFSLNAAAELKVYDVDPKYRQEVYSALRGVLMREHDPKGSVELLPTGQILIDTDAANHAQVVTVLDAISAHQAEAAPRVTLRYWAVLGSPTGAQEADIPDMLADTVDELRRVHGDLAFRVVANASLLTESGQSGNMSGDRFSVSQLAYVQGETLNADLRINYEYLVETGRFDSNAEGVNPFATMQRRQLGVQINTSMAQDEFVVVGENSVDIETGDDAIQGTIFYIVHWPAAE